MVEYTNLVDMSNTNRNQGANMNPEILIMTNGPSYFPIVEDHSVGPTWMVNLQGGLEMGSASVHMNLTGITFEGGIHLLSDAQVSTLLREDRTKAITQNALRPTIEEN